MALISLDLALGTSSKAHALLESESEMKVSISFTPENGAPDEVYEIYLTEQALDDVRFKFNPSGLDKVAKLKTLAAAYLSLVAQYGKENPDAGREFAIVRTDMQKVSMSAVFAATKGL